jgi:hypothetical protein
MRAIHQRPRKGTLRSDLTWAPEPTSSSAAHLGFSRQSTYAGSLNLMFDIFILAVSQDVDIYLTRFMLL